MNEVKELREGNNSLKESVESSLNAFDISLSNLQSEKKSFIDNSVNATIQILYDRGLFDRLENKDEIVKDNITFKKRQRGQLELDN